ncbi:hypothetical protein [Vreelandella olivaria]|uniref:hypothetical protein n=1 Tax=Vreelandella olivaria TaxID=390919 RepID=UPI00201FB084|nr:hypothetical protein [Halomonas olivaria]
MSMDQQYTDALKELEEVKAERDEYRNHLAVIAEMTGNAGDIGAAHEGVNALMEELARHKRLFAATCQQLGSIQQALGSIQQALGSTVVGIEPALVRELVEERDALAAHVERQSELLRRLVSAMRNYEMDADPDYPPPRDHRAMMSDAEAALGAAPETSLDRRDFMTKADAFTEAAAICRKVQKGQNSLAWMHKAVSPDGEEYVDEYGIPYSNKAMGAGHCVDDLLREEKKFRKQAEGHQ